jgi:hypothetical protein
VAQPTDAGGVEREIDPEREALLNELVKHGVAFVLIGRA